MWAPNFYSAVYAIIRDESGKILFSQRKNSKFMDGKYQLPAGHMDGGETMLAAMRRELQEELAIDAREEDMKVVHISHASFFGYDYFNIFVEVSRFDGTPIVNEPKKCGGIAYFDITTVDRNDFAGYDIDAVLLADRWIAFSETNTRDYE